MSDDFDPTTVARRPFPNRPKTGLLAWQATIGYISMHHSPDALLKLEAYATPEGVLWAASASWGQVEEERRDMPSLGDALRELWLDIGTRYQIFTSMEDAARSPIHYKDHEWLDEQTAKTLDHLIHILQTVYPDDWHVIIIYQPVENPQTRVQSRLIASQNRVQAGGRGPTIRDACHVLYHNIARYIAANRRNQED
ncbi:MAG: hypothetical protein D6712_19945 [Chloroflexi bacterium]|nr:MAG: hypothetical protein D6712_19945 [Chloroflexota bacterium]